MGIHKSWLVGLNLSVLPRAGATWLTLISFTKKKEKKKKVIANLLMISYNPSCQHLKTHTRSVFIGKVGLRVTHFYVYGISLFIISYLHFSFSSTVILPHLNLDIHARTCCCQQVPNTGIGVSKLKIQVIHT